MCSLQSVACTLRCQRPEPIPNQVVELDEDKSMAIVVGDIDGGMPLYLFVFPNPTVVFEGRQWNGTMSQSLKCRRNKIGGRQLAGIYAVRKGIQTKHPTVQATWAGTTAKQEYGL